MTRQIRNVYSGERLNLDQEIATGTDGILYKGGQGEWPDYPRADPSFWKKAEDRGLPWGITWQFDARYSPERHKAAIKQWFPTGHFGPLGLWLCVEMPFYPCPDLLYWSFPYANYKNVESIWRGVQAYTGVYPGIYTSVSKWHLVFGGYPQTNARKCPDSLQEEIAAKAELMVAQYGVTAPTPFGAWKGRWVMWQYRENPDFSVCSDEWFAARVGTVTPPVEPPAPVVEYKTYTITTEYGANERECADITSPIIGGLPEGTRISAAAEGDWLKLFPGYIFGTLATSEPVTEPEPEPEPEPPTPPAPAPSNLYDIKIRTVEWLEQPAPASVGSFAIVGGRGIDCWLQIGPKEVAFIKSIKIPEKHVDNALIWNWASGAGTRAGVTVYYSNDPLAGTWRWGIGLMSSFSGLLRQYCRIEKFDPTAKYQFVSGIPYQSSGDYSAWTPDKHPEMWFYCYSIYPPKEGYPNGYLGPESHNGYVFLMPYFQPGTGFKQSAAAASYGGWIATSVFVGPHK